jgi:hypothetical protein
MPKSDTQFKPGNPGRPVGAVGGRQKLVNELDKLLSKEANTKLVIEAWQKELRDKPLAFWLRYVVPLLPKETLLKLSGGSDTGRGLVEAVAAVLNAKAGDNGKPKEARPERSTSRYPGD